MEQQGSTLHRHVSMMLLPVSWIWLVDWWYAKFTIPVFYKSEFGWNLSFFCFFFVQFNVPFKIISLISRRANQKVGRKWEYRGKNHLTHPQVELDLSHLWPVWGSNPHQSQRWDDRMVKGDNEISHLNHSATGARLNLSLFIYWIVEW